MSTIAEKLQRILDCKTAIKNAIITKGVEVLSSTPLADYADKILQISSDGGFTDSTSKVDGANENLIKFNDSIRSYIGYAENFTINGHLNQSGDRGEIYSGFSSGSSGNYIKDIYNSTETACIYRFKVMFTDVSDWQNIMHVEQVINLDIHNGKIAAYSWETGYSPEWVVGPTTEDLLVANKWYYFSIRCELATDTNYVTKEYFLSDTRFGDEYISSPTYLGAIIDTRGSNSSQNCIGVSSWDYGSPLKGYIDMKETCVVDLDGNILWKPLYNTYIKLLPTFTANTTTTTEGDWTCSASASYSSSFDAYVALNGDTTTDDNCWWTGDSPSYPVTYTITCPKNITFNTIRIKNEHQSPEYYATCSIYSDTSKSNLLGTITNDLASGSWNTLQLDNSCTTNTIYMEFTQSSDGISVQQIEVLYIVE